MSLAQANEWKHLAQKWQQRATKAEAALEKFHMPCWWTMNKHGEYFDTGCGDIHYGVLSAYCPECGHRVEVQP